MSSSRRFPGRWVAVLASCVVLTSAGHVGAAKKPFLFPEPQEARFGASLALLRSSPWRIVTAPQADPLVEKAVERLERLFARLGVRVARTRDGRGPAILLGVQGRLPVLDRELKKARAVPRKEAQGYSLVVREGPRVLIGGRDGSGVLYGVTTFEQLIEPAPGGRQLRVRSCSIRDWPDIKQRIWGELDGGGFASFKKDVSYNERFPTIFEKYIQDSLVRRRINVISTRMGGFKYHDKRGGDPVLRERLRIAVRLAREYGIEIEYADVTLVETDQKLKNTAPYSELIWHHRNWGGAFFCYTREELIRQAAERLSEFLLDVGLSRVYLHQFDGHGGGWADRCSLCRRKYPDDVDKDKASLGRAQAFLGNVYYETLKAKIPDLQFTMVPTVYQGVRGVPVYHDTLHRELNKNIRLVLRESTRSEVEAWRRHYRNRPVYIYVEPDASIEYDALFTWIARFNKDYFFDDPRDALFVWTRETGDRQIDASSYAFYAWNVDARGAEHAKEPILDPIRDTRRLPSEARETLDDIVRYEYGPEWVGLFSDVALTWLSVGALRDPQLLDPLVKRRRGRWRWERVRQWFAEPLRGKRDSEAWLEFHRLQLAEARRVAPLYEKVFSRPDVPPELWRVYALGMGACVLAEPRLREVECRIKRRPDAAMLRAARESVDRAAALAVQVSERIRSRAGTNGWRSMRVDRALEGIRQYLDSATTDGTGGGGGGKKRRSPAKTEPQQRRPAR